MQTTYIFKKNPTTCTTVLIAWLLCVSVYFHVWTRQPAERWNRPKRRTLRSWFYTRTANLQSTVSQKKMKCFLCMKPKWCNVDQSLVHLQHVTGPGLMIFIWTVKFEVCGVVGAGVTSWVKNWKLNNWRLKSGGPITNKDDFMKLDRLNAELEVVWVNISLHHLSLHPDLNPSLSC